MLSVHLFSSLSFYNYSKLSKNLYEKDLYPAEIRYFGDGFAIDAIYCNIFFAVRASDRGAVVVAFGLVVFLSVFFPNFNNAMDDRLGTVALED